MKNRGKSIGLSIRVFLLWNGFSCHFGGRRYIPDTMSTGVLLDESNDNSIALG